MALPDERADILGGPIMQRPETGISATLSRFSFVFETVALLGFALLAWRVFNHGIEQIKRRREIASRKAMRRKHGIPDSDCRPFAVAYAAARRARVEREAKERNKTTNQGSDHLPPVIDQRTYAQKDAHGLRRRVPETTVPLRDQYPPAKRAVVYDNKRPDGNPLNFADRYNPNPRSREVVPELSPVRKPTARRASRKDLFVDARAHEESRKRSLVDESDNEHETMKKSRIDGDELIDGDEQADWYAQYTDLHPRRMFQESPDRQLVGNYVDMDGQENFDRANGSRDEDHELADEAMEGIDEDEVTELRTGARGKKRDRAEAGSTFGGDDEEDIQNGKVLHHRKRRTISRRQSGMLARGHKRDREADMLESDGEGDASETSRSYAKRSSKKKKGKKAATDEDSEISAEDPRVSKDPLCGGRRIGEEWQADGIQYKVGDKGDRLRLALVKKARSKYHMPQDSQHPDRSAALEIYVETWMTEAQYKQAEEEQELAWQDAPRGSNGSKTPDIPESPTKTGKNLLWDSVKGSPARRPFRQSISTGASIRINPFEQVHSQPALGRRVASSSTMVSPIFPGITNSPTRPGFRGFSKWEKQDREAEAMARIRAKLQEQKTAQTPKPVELPASATAPELGSKPISVPTITLTPAPSAPVVGKLDDTTSQSKPTTSTFSFAPTPSTSGSSKVTVSTTTTASPVPPITPSTTPLLFPGSSPAPTASTGAASSAAAFSFTKPPQVPSSTPSVTTTTAPSSTSVPNFFGKTASSTPGSTIQTQPSSTDSAAPKPTPFSFGKSDTQPSTLPTPAAGPSIFATGPGASTTPSPLSFGPTPAAAKAETPAFTSSSTAPSSDGIKPSAPLFSFSAAPSSTTTAPATSSEGTKPSAPLFSFPTAPSSTNPTTAPATSSAPSAPKFSFGQSSAAQTSFAPTPSLTPNATSQPKPTLFKFGQTSTASTDGASVSTPAVTNESKKSESSPSILGSTGETAKPSPFGEAPSAFRGSAFPPSSTSGTNIFGKPSGAGANATTSPPNPTSTTSGSPTTLNNMFSTAPAGSPAFGTAPTSAFSFSGANSGLNVAEGSKPSPLFGAGAEGSKPASVFGGSAVGSKPTFAFGATPEGSKPTSVLDGENAKPTSTPGASMEGSKPTFAFGGSTDSLKPTSAFGGGAESSKSPFSFGGEAPKPTFTFSGAAQSKPTSVFSGVVEGSKPTSFSSNGADTSKPSSFGGAGPAAQPVSAFGSATFGSSSSPSPFAFGKKDDTTEPSTSASSKPASPFAFGGSSGTTASVFGQPSTSSANVDQTQSIFGKPANATPGAFGFNASGTSTSAFAFNKPAAQNQKQEQ